MSYFHPWTLNPNTAGAHVPFMGHLCEAGMTWHASMLRWFDGRILCAEVKRYIDNFLVVTRSRPEDVDDEQHEEAISDEELIVGQHNFSKVVKTRMGAGRQQASGHADMDGECVEEAAPGAHQATKEAFDLARRMWSVPPLQDGLHQEEGIQIDADQLKKAFAAAAASQKNDFKFEYTAASAEGPGPSARQHKSYNAADIEDWLRKTRQEKNKKGQPRWKKGQMEVLEVICKRMCVELQEQASDAPMTDPLLWLVHGSPGTGKSEVPSFRKYLTIHNQCVRACVVSTALFAASKVYEHRRCYSKCLERCK